MEKLREGKIRSWEQEFPKLVTWEWSHPTFTPELQGNPRDVTEDSSSDPSRNAAGISLISLLQPCSTVFLDETLDCPDPRPGCAPGLLPSSGGAGTLQSVKMIPLRKLEDIPAWNNNGDTGKRGGKYF